MDLEGFLGSIRVVPVVEAPSAAAAVELAGVLADSGLPCTEITFRTEAAAEAIAAVCDRVPRVTVGAGTVLTAQQAEAAVEAGAQFLVSPGLDREIVAAGRRLGVDVLPGVCTPTEIQAALAEGLTLLKFFPAEAIGGVSYLKAIAAPFGGVRFVPTGGIGPANVAGYLALPQVIACGGSWMVKKDLVAAGEWDTIGRLAAEAAALAGSEFGAPGPLGAPAAAGSGRQGEV